MLHSQIENEEFVERYVRNRLAPEERQAFEEHFLGCDECFEKLQTVERFAAGLRDAADRGLLDRQSPAEITAGRTWSRAFAATACVALTLAGLVAWIYFGRARQLRAELRQTTAQLELERQLRAEIEHAVPTAQAEANVPLVMLQASRAREEAARVMLKPDDQQLVLWIEPGPSRYRDFRLEVFSTNNHLLTSINHLKPGRYGALAASLPTNQLPSGDFRITLTGQDPLPAALAGEYHLKIRRP